MVRVIIAAAVLAQSATMAAQDSIDVPVFVLADVPPDIEDIEKKAVAQIEQRRRKEFNSHIAEAVDIQKQIDEAKPALTSPKVKSMTRIPKNGKILFPSKREKERYIGQLENKRDSELGQAKVIGENPLYWGRGDLSVEVGAVFGGPKTSLHVIQIIDTGAKPCRIGRGQNSSILWVTGLATENAVDDKEYLYEGGLLIDGTKTYRNAAGSTNKVFTARPFKLEDYVRLPAKRAVSDGGTDGPGDEGGKPPGGGGD